jgi:ATP-binding cassette subfamily B protein
VLPPQNYSAAKSKNKILIADPACGLVKANKETFLKSWISKQDKQGIVLMLEPTPVFYQHEDDARDRQKSARAHPSESQARFLQRFSELMRIQFLGGAFPEPQPLVAENVERLARLDPD